MAAVVAAVVAVAAAVAVAAVAVAVVVVAVAAAAHDEPALLKSPASASHDALACRQEAR